MTYQGLEFLKLQETKRHNLAGELISQQTVDETVRANKARETETTRHNLAQELLGQLNYQEVVRSNKENESIRREQNRITEQHYQRVDSISQYQAETQRTSVENQQKQFEENLTYLYDAKASDIKLKAYETNLKYAPDIVASSFASNALPWESGKGLGTFVGVVWNEVTDLIGEFL